MDNYTQVNQENWDARTDIHAHSEFYDVAGFRAGRNALNPVEIEELGDVAGKTLLHLQCHFGQDTLSWARLGAARVMGADFSEKAIALARQLAEELNLDAQFVCTDIYDLPEHLHETFDVVYTGGGAVNWLGDLGRWADVVVHFLKPGGVFYLREFHPYGSIFANEDDIPGINELKVLYPYFTRKEPFRFESDGSYTDGGAGVPIVSYEWFHPVSDVVTALVTRGLRLEFLHEFPFSDFQQFPFMEQRDDGNWCMVGDRYNIPLMYSLRAIKPGPA